MPSAGTLPKGCVVCRRTDISPRRFAYQIVGLTIRHRVSVHSVFLLDVFATTVQLKKLFVDHSIRSSNIAASFAVQQYESTSVDSSVRNALHGFVSRGALHPKHSLLENSTQHEHESKCKTIVSC